MSLFFILGPLLGVSYVGWRLWQILPLQAPLKALVLVLLSLGFVMLYLNMSGKIDQLTLNQGSIIYKVSTSWMIVLFYLFWIFLILDLGRLIRLVPHTFLQHSVSGTLTVLLLIVGLLTYGNIRYHHKARIPLELTTSKPLLKPLKVIMISDLHLGYHIRRAEIAKWVELINAESPDLVLIGGDLTDNSMRPVLEERMEEELRKIKAPIYACLGNHEYYGGIEVVREFYQRAGIHLLTDSSADALGITIIGRNDKTQEGRKPLSELMKGIDPTRFTILLDHQPSDLKPAEQAGIDLQFSGHTHYGQVWPASWLEHLIFEKPYGKHQRGDTRYYISSGLGIWGGKFRIGTKSEYVVLSIVPQQ